MAIAGRAPPAKGSHINLSRLAQAIAYVISFVACAWVFWLGFMPEQDKGLTVVVLILSSIAWLAASIASDFPWKSIPSLPNLLNAVAASLAAVAGMTTVAHGWEKAAHWVSLLIQ